MAMAVVTTAFSSSEERVTVKISLCSKVLSLTMPTWAHSLDSVGVKVISSLVVEKSAPAVVSSY